MPCEAEQQTFEEACDLLTQAQETAAALIEEAQSIKLDASIALALCLLLNQGQQAAQSTSDSTSLAQHSGELSQIAKAIGEGRKAKQKLRDLCEKDPSVRKALIEARRQVDAYGDVDVVRRR